MRDLQSLIIRDEYDEGGYIIMDDSDWNGVKNSINRFLLPHCDLVDDIGTTSYFKKR